MRHNTARIFFYGYIALVFIGFINRNPFVVVFGMACASLMTLSVFDESPKRKRKEKPKRKPKEKTKRKSHYERLIEKYGEPPPGTTWRIE